MTVMTMTGAASGGEIDWHSTDWPQVHRTVRRLQNAYCEGNQGTTLGQGESPAMASDPLVAR